jgi:hypothetical protein
MKARCYKESHPSFHDYGGRGIGVCAEWRNSFPAFLADMGEKPSPDLQIERLNNDLDYGPGNCIWSTAKAQARNRRNNRLYEVDGKLATISEWSEEFGVGYQTIRKRLDAGWPPAEAVKRKPMSFTSAGSFGGQSRKAA